MQFVVPSTPLPPRIAVMPELSPADVAWLNRHLELCGQPEVRYARTHPPSPPPSGRKAPPDTSWITMTTIRY